MGRSGLRDHLLRCLELWIRNVARLVPAYRRGAWIEEWAGESWYAYAASPDAPPRRVARLAVAVLCDAWIVRRSSYRPRTPERGDNKMHILKQDLRYGLRTLAKAPLVTAVVVLTLGLGIGAVTAIFSVVDALLLRPLPYDDAERLVILWQQEPQKGIEEDWFSPAQFVDLREQNEVFEEMALTIGGAIPLLGRGRAEEVGYLRATSSYLEMLGATPLVGRSLDARDDEEASEVVALLTYGLWQNRFGSDPDVVGERIRLGSREIEVVGVLPQELLLNAEVMPTVGSVGRIDLVLSLPLTEERLQNRGSENYNIVARLQAGVGVERAQGDIDLIAERMRESHPDRYSEDLSIVVLPLLDEVVGGVRRALVVLLGAVAVLLLIACGNVANLLLSRGAARRREMGIRLAIGAGHTRLIQQLLTEGFLLAIFSGVFGLGLAQVGVRLLHRMGESSDLPRLAEVAVDGRVLAFTLAVTVLTCLVFALVPAYRATRLDPAEPLRGGRGTTQGTLWARFNLASGLVIGEIALSLVLLIGGGLLGRSFFALQKVDPGFRADSVLTFKVALSGERYQEATARADFYRRLSAALRAQPGVVEAGITSHLPFGPGVAWGTVDVEGHVSSDPDERIVTDFRFAGPRYFEALGIPLLEGRSFSEGDDTTQPAVVMVDQRFAEIFWPDGEAIGKRVEAWSEGWATVVGVVGSVKHSSLDRDSRPVLYYPHRQIPTSTMFVAARTALAPEALVESVLREVQSLESDAAVTGIMPMAQRLAGSLAQRRFSMLLLQAFSAIALLLAAVGLYGVVAYRVSLGVQDLGVRMALGATPGTIQRMVLANGMRMAVFGIAAGLIGALFVTRLLASMVWSVSVTDALTYSALSSTLVAVTLFACWIPAWRASRVDPLDGLRE